MSNPIAYDSEVYSTSYQYVFDDELGRPPRPGTLYWQVCTEGSLDSCSGVRALIIDPIPGQEVNAQNNFCEYRGEPVNTATGNYFYSRTDIRVPSIGFPFEFTRTYNVIGRQASSLGWGWTHTFESSVAELVADGTVELVWGNGRLDTYVPMGGGHYQPFYKGYEGDLIKTATGTFRFVTKGQMTYEFDSNNRLAWIRDRNGNREMMHYHATGLLERVTDTANRDYLFDLDLANSRIDGVTDPLGRYHDYVYDTTGDLVQYIDPRGNFYEYTYDDSHRILTITDRRGITFLINEYDTSDRVIHQWTAKDGEMTFSYDSDTGITTFTDTLAKTTEHTYDGLFRVQNSVDELGLSTDTDYDSNNRPARIVDRNGNTMEYVHDTRGNRTSTEDAYGYVSTAAYDLDNNLTAQTDALSRTTEYEYDMSGNLAKIIYSTTNQVEYRYDTHGQLLAATDAEGNVTGYEYDSCGNRILIRDASGSETRYAYDLVGRVVSVTDSMGRITLYSYDAADNVVAVTETFGLATERVTRYEYDENGDRTKVINPRSSTTEYAYDEHDLVIAVTDALGVVTEYAYDAMDRIVCVTEDALGLKAVTRTGYDAAGRVIATTDPLGNITTYTYDSNGNRIMETNPNGHSAYYAYDRLNRLVGTSDNLGNTSYSVYDAVGRLIESRDPKGNSTQYQYDSLDRLVKIIDAEAGTASFEYDKNGNRTKITDPNSHETTFVYDEMNRLIQKTDAEGNTTFYTYNALGNLKTRTDANGDTTTYSYDSLNRLASIDYDDPTPDASFSYDANGNRILMSMPAAGFLEDATYSYDDLDRLKAVKDPWGKTVQYEYDNLGNRSKIIYPDCKEVEYTYDLAGRLIHVTAWNVVEATYAYDAAGNVIAVTYGNGTVEERAYDLADRLIRIRHEKPSGADIWEATFTLDANGNHRAHDRNDLVGREMRREEIDYTYDDADRITGATDEYGPDSTFVFDNNGNMTQMNENGDTTYYTYDAENRLLTVTSPSFNATYDYNADGHRLAATRNGTETRYVLDPNGPLENVLCEMDNTNTINVHYIYGLGLVARVDANTGEVGYYHCDQIGSTMAISDATATIVKAYNYDEFGAVQGESGSLEQPFQFGGKVGLQAETESLLFARRRFYHSVSGIFVSLDPLTDYRYLYSYAHQNPLVFIDPSGMLVWGFGGGASFQWGGQTATTMYYFVKDLHGNEGIWYTASSGESSNRYVAEVGLEFRFIFDFSAERIQDLEGRSHSYWAKFKAPGHSYLLFSLGESAIAGINPTTEQVERIILSGSFSFGLSPESLAAMAVRHLGSSWGMPSLSVGQSESLNRVDMCPGILNESAVTRWLIGRGLDLTANLIDYAWNVRKEAERQLAGQCNK